MPFFVVVDLPFEGQVVTMYQTRAEAQMAFNKVFNEMAVDSQTDDPPSRTYNGVALIEGQLLEEEPDGVIERQGVVLRKRVGPPNREVFEALATQDLQR